jgi:hypothetical protein
MADTVACCCPGTCGLQHSGICGKPVEKPLEMQDRSGGEGPWRKMGLCEACWETIQAKK